MMLSGVPNFVFAIGYTNASWTLKVDLVCEYFCRLLAYLDQRGLDAAVPEVTDAGMELQQLLDFEAGYVRRALHELPKQGTRSPWHLSMNYAKDARNLRDGPIEDEAIRFFAARGEPARDPATVPA
jgi:monooxygenase